MALLDRLKMINSKRILLLTESPGGNFTSIGNINFTVIWKYMYSYGIKEKGDGGLLTNDSFEFFEGRRGWTIRLKGKRNRDHHGHVDTEEHCKAIIKDILDGFLPDDEEDVECCRRILDEIMFCELKPHPHVPHRKDRYKNTYCKRCRR